MCVQQTVACNDNLYVNHMFCYRNSEYGDHLDLIKYMSLARTLIKKYSASRYKHSPDAPDYLFLEYQVSTILNKPNSSPIQRTIMLTSLAWILETSVIKLLHDPLIVIDAKGLARFP